MFSEVARLSSGEISVQPDLTRLTTNQPRTIGLEDIAAQYIGPSASPPHLPESLHVKPHRPIIWTIRRWAPPGGFIYNDTSHRCDATRLRTKVPIRAARMSDPTDTRILTLPKCLTNLLTGNFPNRCSR